MRYYGYGKHRTPEDSSRCAAQIYDREYGGKFRQCSRGRGYGFYGLLCWQHAHARSVCWGDVKVPEDYEARKGEGESK
jgi:hypothetical protein